MNEPILALIGSYEDKISVVEELIEKAYQVTVASSEHLNELDNEKERLKACLRELLARNCSLRKKDFNRIVKRLFDDSEGKRKEIEEKQKQASVWIKDYLDSQKKLFSSLREKFMEFTQGKTNKEGLEKAINDLNVAFQKKSEEALSGLRNFQLQLEVFKKEQEEINHKLKRLADRGGSLRTEDLRQLEAIKDRENRKAEKELRQQEVERLLLHFKEQRQWGNSHGR